MTISAYDLYQIGDTFHNSNGEDYIIFGLNAERDKALLTKKLDTRESKIINSSALFIGAKGLSINDWAYGHYFMSDFQKAVEWFLTDDMIDKASDMLTVEKFFKNCIAYNGSYWIKFIISKYGYNGKDSTFYEYLGNIPSCLKSAFIVEWSIFSHKTEMNCPEIQIPVFVIYLDLKYNPELREFYDNNNNFV